MSDKTMMILFRRILSQRNLIYANVLVSASLWSQKKSILLLLWLVKRSVAPSKFDKYMVWEEVKMYHNLSLYFLENVLYHNFTRLLLLLKWMWTIQLSIISISCIWDESSVRRFLLAAFIENSKLYRSVSTTSTS